MIFNWFKKKQVQLTYFKVSRSGDIYKILKKRFNCKIKTWDKLYKQPDYKSFRTFLKNNAVNTLKRVEEYRDCDDFAVMLWADYKKYFKGGTLGLATSKTHAFNIFIDNNDKIYIIEPSSDTIYTKNTHAEYQPEEIII